MVLNLRWVDKNNCASHKLQESEVVFSFMIAEFRNFTIR